MFLFFVGCIGFVLSVGALRQLYKKSFVHKSWGALKLFVQLTLSTLIALFSISVIAFAAVGHTAVYY